MEHVSTNGVEGRLVRRLIDQGIRDPRVLAAFARVPRSEFRIGDGREGWPDAAPFDAILVAAAPEEMPPALLEQLAPGGRLVIPVGPTPETQVLELWRRVPSTGALERKTLMHVRFVPLT